MKVVVLEHPRIRSGFHFNDIANTPLWSCLMGGYVSSTLKEYGFDVTYLDAAYKNLGFEETLDEIVSIHPDLLTVNAIYFWENTPKLFELLKDIKKMVPKIHINLFGFFPSLAFVQILKEASYVDSIAVGECEFTIVELSKALRLNGDISQISGLATRANIDGNTFRKRIPVDDPDVFPYPERYYERGGTISILGSRGCYNQCSFCLIPAFYYDGSKWRGRRPFEIAKEIELLKNNGIQDFYFVDANFIGPGHRGKQRALELASYLKPLNITYGMETRPNDIDYEIVVSLKESGLKTLLLGIESASQSVLGKLKKRTDAQVSSRAIEILREVGIEPEIGFIMFEPDSTILDIETNFEFLKENRLLDRLDRTLNLLSHRQIVFRNTPGFRYYESQGRIKSLGPFGFQAEVEYKDKRVKAMADEVIPRCLSLLKDMEEPSSPIFWKKPMTEEIPTKINQDIVAFFEELLKRAKRV